MVNQTCMAALNYKIFWWQKNPRTKINFDYATRTHFSQQRNLLRNITVRFSLSLPKVFQRKCGILSLIRPLWSLQVACSYWNSTVLESTYSQLTTISGWNSHWQVQARLDLRTTISRILTPALILNYFTAEVTHFHIHSFAAADFIVFVKLSLAL